MSTSAICMSIADASSGCNAFSCLSSTTSRVSARGGRGGRSGTDEFYGKAGNRKSRKEAETEEGGGQAPSSFVVMRIRFSERQPEAQTCQARADPPVRVLE